MKEHETNMTGDPEMRELVEALQEFADVVGEDSGAAFQRDPFAAAHQHFALDRALQNAIPYFPDNELGQRLHGLADTFDGFTNELGKIVRREGHLDG